MCVCVLACGRKNECACVCVCVVSVFVSVFVCMYVGKVPWSIDLLDLPDICFT